MKRKIIFFLTLFALMGIQKCWSQGGPSFILSQAVPAGTLTTVVTQSSVSTTLPAYDFPEGSLIKFVQDLVTLAGTDSSTKAVIDKYNLVLKDASGIQTYPPPPPPPSTGTISVVPASSTSHTVNLVFSFPIPSGGLGAVNSVNMLINSTLTGVSGCYVIYTPTANTINLVKDDGSTLQPATPGATATLSNSQCSLPVGQVIAGSASTAVTVTLQQLTFAAAFAGAKTIWATWYSGGQQQGTWQSIGTITAQ